MKGCHLRVRTTGAGVAGFPGDQGASKPDPNSPGCYSGSLWEGSGVRVSLGLPPAPPSSQTLSLAALGAALGGLMASPGTPPGFLPSELCSALQGGGAENQRSW